MENTPNNLTKGIAKSFLPCEKRYGEKTKSIAKNMAFR